MRLVTPREARMARLDVRIVSICLACVSFETLMAAGHGGAQCDRPPQADVATVQKDINVAQYQKAIQTAFREVADGLAARGYVPITAATRCGGCETRWQPGRSLMVTGAKFISRWATPRNLTFNFLAKEQS
jgi:hypothetical protein